ncbi:MAG: hypothetical protein NVV82_25790 [Sporocytophaga sp.]|nr:hypothetical protein [Sporocytophaga sp.]
MYSIQMVRIKQTLLILILFLCFVKTSHAQKTDEQKLQEIQFLKGQSEINIIFTYDSLMVGEKTEDDYIKEKVEGKNSKNEGKGDYWLQKWNEDKQVLFPKQFIDQFNNKLKKKGLKAVPQSKSFYTLIVKSTRIEPGFVSVVNKPAAVDFEFRFIETDNPEKTILKLKIINVAGDALYTEYNVSARIQECYNIAGKLLGKYINEYLFR